MAIQAEETLQTLLSANWNAANTNNLTPLFRRVYASKNLRLETRGAILVHAIQKTAFPEIGNVVPSRRDHEVKIDVRARSQDQVALMITEVERITESNQVNPDANFNVLETTTGDWNYLNNELINLFRATKTFTLKEL